MSGALSAPRRSPCGPPRRNALASHARSPRRRRAVPSHRPPIINRDHAIRHEFEPPSPLPHTGKPLVKWRIGQARRAGTNAAPTLCCNQSLVELALYIVIEHWSVSFAEKNRDTRQEHETGERLGPLGRGAKRHGLPLNVEHTLCALQAVKDARLRSAKGI
jgi:hypothetical protein